MRWITISFNPLFHTSTAVVQTTTRLSHFHLSTTGAVAPLIVVSEIQWEKEKYKQFESLQWMIRR